MIRRTAEFLINDAANWTGIPSWNIQNGYGLYTRSAGFQRLSGIERDVFL